MYLKVTSSIILIAWLRNLINLVLSVLLKSTQIWGNKLYDESFLRNFILSHLNLQHKDSNVLFLVMFISHLRENNKCAWHNSVWWCEEPKRTVYVRDISATTNPTCIFFALIPWTLHHKSGSYSLNYEILSNFETLFTFLRIHVSFIRHF
jgi:hypothetical protein